MELDIQTSKVLKGALSILIILHHLQYGVELPYFSLFKPIGAPVVSVFFFLSGYGLMSSYNQKGISYLNGFLKKRLWLIIEPFVIVTLFYLLLSYFDKGSLNSSILSDLIFKGITPLPYSWFVFTIVLFYIYFYFVFSIKMLNNKWKIISIVALTFLYILIARNILAYDRAWWVSALGFPMGLIYKYRQQALNVVFNSIYKKVFGLLFFSAVGACLIQTRTEWLYTLVYALIPVIVTLLISCFDFPKPKLLGFLGGISYEIYLLHGVWIVLLRGKYIHITSDAFYILTVFSLTIATSYLLNILLNKKKNLHESTSSR